MMSVCNAADSPALLDSIFGTSTVAMQDHNKYHLTFSHKWRFIFTRFVFATMLADSRT